MKNFRSYQLAVQFYRNHRNITLPRHLKDQFLRASSSIALNLAEGWGKGTTADKKRFFHIAMGSIRECQAIMELTSGSRESCEQLDHLAASVYKLIHRGR